MSKKGKITVKHYLNTNLKPIKDNGQDTYPVYVQIIYKSTNFKIKSENSFFKYLSKEQLENETFVAFLNEELKRIERCVNLLSEHNEKLLTSKDINRFSKPLHIVIENNFKKLIKKEIANTPKLILDLSYSEINNLIFFFNAFEDFDQKSETVKIVKKCINQIDYPDLKTYNSDYIVADLYFGDNYTKIFNDISMCGLNKNETNTYIKKFQYLTEL